MNAIYLLIGVLVGAGIVYALMRSRGDAAADVAELVAPLDEQLRRVDSQLTALDRERAEASGRLEQHLRMLSASSERLRDETGALVTALRRPNVRGQWGQMQLRRVVELAGLVNHCDFSEQTQLGDGRAAGQAGHLRPDIVVRLPGGKEVPVDAKAPLQALLDAYEAHDEDARANFMHDHARLLRRHVRVLADKSYWDQMSGAPDFVVMFLPGEHLYAAAYEADPELVEDAMAQRVLIATPTTLLALLHSVSYGWQQERVADSAREISELGRELHRRLTRLSGLMTTLGKRLGSTVTAFNEAVGSYEARVMPAARRFEDLGVTPADRDEQPVPQLTIGPRAVAND
jgi:DNA recombination protein RmuC